MVTVEIMETTVGTTATTTVEMGTMVGTTATGTYLV
jgi:hypothetical protein